jgi:hypothetical protein
MIHFTKGQTDKIVLTLTEKASLNSPNYLFIFKSRNTNDEVKFVLLNNADVSLYPSRYNEFHIVANTYFTNINSGEYSYEVYEQSSTTNTDASLTTGLLEKGQMSLKNSTNFSFTTYNESVNTYKVRDI